MPRNDIDIIKNEYLEFIIVKTLGNDDGLNAAEIKFLPFFQIYKLWKCHTLCIKEYDKSMLYVNKINPLLDFIHYTITTSPERRLTTAIAYRWIGLYFIIFLIIQQF